MMQMRSFPMNRSDGSKISLEELLTVVPGSQWTWYVLDFYGIGCTPGGQTMVSFEEEVRSSENGIAMTWAELNDFARALDQTIDCQIVAGRLEKPVSRDRVERKDFRGYEMVLDGFDSTKWAVWAHDASVSDRVVRVASKLG
ncbi:Uncharacterised protein [Serratia liquefaciens]|jgi:hypothetical protein|uniref:hypothetical protein n=1 Tax=Serratia liquefaciens TaxID=614 RepID=UPI00217A0B0B|nr:hypothetical protein [Serratia liquefaciens]CAI1074372.1 Uncharacterised protein [Serratia liquefaciens]CAI1098607.1 Uncharacterised protein [Serratia liquefaciens]